MNAPGRKLILAALVCAFFTAAKAAPPIPIELPIADVAFGESAHSLSVHLYLSPDDGFPVASQRFAVDQWRLRTQWTGEDGDEHLLLTADFTQYEGLVPGETVYAEIVIDGYVVGERLELLVPDPLLSVAGVIESQAGGFQFPDGSVQETTGITVEADPTVPAYIYDGIQWGEVSDRPTGLDDGDDDTTYSAGTGVDIQTATIGLLSGYQLPQACSEQEVATWSGSAWVCGSPPVGGLAWSLSGNAGTSAANFLGTTDSQALDLRVNSARALRLEPGVSSPNVLGGYGGNAAAGGVSGAAIAGGGRDLAINEVTADFAAVGGGAGNTAGAYAATIGGGEGHSATGAYAAIGGGRQNAAGDDAVVGGGQGNQAGGSHATIGGGGLNAAAGAYSAIGGGANNAGSGIFSGVGGGSHNDAQARYSTIAGGGPWDEANPATTNNRVTDNYGFVGGGGGNTAGDGAGTADDTSFATIGGGRQNSAAGAYSVVGGGDSNTASNTYAVVAGGSSNNATGQYSTIGGGNTNIASGQYAAVGGGRSNSATQRSSTVGGGEVNQATGAFATVPGGAQNTAGGTYSLAAGQGATAAHAGSFVWSDSDTEPFSTTADDQFLVRATGGVGIGTDSPSEALHVVGNTRFKGNTRILGEDDLVFLGSTNQLAPDCLIGDPGSDDCLLRPESISVVGNTALVVSSSSNVLTAFDVTDPEDIQVIDITTSSLRKPRSVKAAGSHVFVASHGLGREYLAVFELFGDPPDRLINIGTVKLSGKPQDVFVSGSYAYLVGSDISSGENPFLAVVDISDPSDPLVRGSVPTGGRSVHVSGRLAYVAGPTGLDVYSVSDPDEIVPVGSTTAQASSPSSVYVVGNRAYVTMEGSNALVVYDISKPAAPVALGASPTGSLIRPVSVKVAGDHAFVACEGDPGNYENNGVVVLDVSDPANIMVRGTTTEAGQQASAIAVAGKRVFVTSLCRTGECDTVEGDRFAIYEFNHLQTPTLQAGNLQAGYLDVVDSASVANGLSVGGGLNAGQAHVGGDLGVGGGLKVGQHADVGGNLHVGGDLHLLDGLKIYRTTYLALDRIGWGEEFVCREFDVFDNCLEWVTPVVQFTSDIGLTTFQIKGSGYFHCAEGRYLPDEECCGSLAPSGVPECLLDVTPVDLFGVAISGDFVPSCDAGDCGPDLTGWNLGHPALRWNEVWAANGLIQTSDARSKTNIDEIPSGLAAIERLRPVTFNWKTEPDAERHYGLVAQEVAEVLPDLVTGAADADVPMAMNYVELVPILIRAIQEQQDQIRALQARLGADD